METPRPSAGTQRISGRGPAARAPPCQASGPRGPSPPSPAPEPAPPPRPESLIDERGAGARAAVSRPRRAAGASSDVASVCPPSRAGCDMHALDSWVNFCFRRGKGALRSPPPAPRAPLSSCEAGLSGRSRRCPRPAAPLHADQGPLTAAFVADAGAPLPPPARPPAAFRWGR